MRLEGFFNLFGWIAAGLYALTLAVHPAMAACEPGEAACTAPAALAATPTLLLSGLACLAIALILRRR